MVQCCDRQGRNTYFHNTNSSMYSFWPLMTVSTHMQIGAATLVLTGIDSILFFKKLCSNKSTIENKLMTDVKKVNKQMLTGKTSEHQRIPVVKENTNE